MNASSVSPVGQKLTKISPKDLKSKKAAASKRTTSWQKMSASDFVRSQPLDTKGREVIAAGAKAGIKISSALVYMVRSRMRAGTSPTTTTPKRGPGRPRKAVPVAAPPVKRGPGRPPKAVAASGALTKDEKLMAELLVRIGLDRTEQLLDVLRRNLAALG